MEVANFANHLQKLKGATPLDLLKRIRWSNSLNKGSIIDVLKLITGLSSSNAGHVWDRLVTSYPEVSKNCTHFQFPGQGQRQTPCADTVTLVEIAYLCPGKAAAQFRRQGAEWGRPPTTPRASLGQTFF